MDQQANSTFKGIMMAFFAIAAMFVVVYGIYYLATVDHRRAAEMDRQMDNLNKAITSYEKFRN